jgi:hypothetical protein
MAQTSQDRFKVLGFDRQEQNVRPRRHIFHRAKIRPEIPREQIYAFLIHIAG